MSKLTNKKVLWIAASFGGGIIDDLDEETAQNEAEQASQETSEHLEQ